MQKVTLAAALMAGTMLATPALAVTIKGNIGATSDYVWRGNTQSNGDASISGGIDVDLGNGFAVGVWTASLGGNQDSDSADYETDLYGSYSFDVGSIGMEVGYIAYQYPGVAASGNDFEEYFVSADFGLVSVSYFRLDDAEDATQNDNKGKYLSIDTGFELNDGWSLGLHYGEEDEIGASDTDTAISLSKGEVTFTVSGDEDDDTRAVVSWGRSF
jgi:uncharacterized protein (TIGR02001 family)